MFGCGPKYFSERLKLKRNKRYKKRNKGKIMFGYGWRTVYKYALRITSTKCSKQLMTLGIFLVR